MRPIPPVDQVFGNRYQAVALIVFCLITMMAPLAVPAIPLEARYAGIPGTFGNYAFIREQIFGSDQPIDILFLGPSAVWTGVDPILIEDTLKGRLKRDATVLNFGTDFYGHEAAYFVLRDTLARRAVRLVVLGVPSARTSAPHLVTPRLADLRLDGRLLQSLPWQSRLTMYSASIFGAPRALLGALRDDGGLTAFASKRMQFSNAGHGQNYDTRAGADVDAATILASEPAAAGGESTLAKGDPRLMETAPAPHQEQLLRAIAALCDQRGVGLVLLRVPLQTDSDRISLPSSDLLDGRLKVIAPMPYFMTLPPQQRGSYYRNAGHLNYRGAVVFTASALPALLRAFEQHTD